MTETHRGEIVLESVLEARPKVFGIGFHKTATTSLAHALYTLGYEVGGYFDVSSIPEGKSLEAYAVEVADQHDALQDMPWPVLYRTLDAAYPGSKFILTVRDTQAWLRSVVTHFGKKVIPTHVQIYGVENAAENPDVYLARYEQHNREVQDYFVDRPGDLLVMDFAAGDDWDELCSFLGVPTPDFTFPTQNKLASVSQPGYVRVARRAAARASREFNQRTASRRGLIDAPTAWRTVHDHCRRGDALFELGDQLDSSAARSALQPVLDHLYRTQMAHLLTLAVIDAPDLPSVEEASTVEAWRRASLLTRHFAGNLDDDGCRARVGDTRVSDVLKEMVNDGLADLQSATSALRDLGVALRTDSALPEPG